MNGPSAQGFLGLTGPLAPRVVVAADAAILKKRTRLSSRVVLKGCVPTGEMLIKSALQDWLAVLATPCFPHYPTDKGDIPCIKQLFLIWTVPF